MLRAGHGDPVSRAAGHSDPRLPLPRWRCVVAVRVDRHFRIVSGRCEANLDRIEKEKSEPIAESRSIAGVRAADETPVRIPEHELVVSVMPDDQHPMIGKRRAWAGNVTACPVGARAPLSRTCAAQYRGHNEEAIVQGLAQLLDGVRQVLPVFHYAASPRAFIGDPGIELCAHPPVAAFAARKRSLRA